MNAHAQEGWGFVAGRGRGVGKVGAGGRFTIDAQLPPEKFKKRAEGGVEARNKDRNAKKERKLIASRPLEAKEDELSRGWGNNNKSCRGYHRPAYARSFNKSSPPQKALDRDLWTRRYWRWIIGTN